MASQGQKGSMSCWDGMQPAGPEGEWIAREAQSLPAQTRRNILKTVDKALGCNTEKHSAAQPAASRLSGFPALRCSLGAVPLQQGSLLLAGESGHSWRLGFAPRAIKVLVSR